MPQPTGFHFLPFIQWIGKARQTQLFTVAAGSAARPLRRALQEEVLSRGAASSTTFVLPNQLLAQVQKQSWSRQAEVLNGHAALAFDQLEQLLFGDCPPTALRPSERILLLQDLLSNAPQDYGRLTGDSPSGKLSYGILQRIDQAILGILARNSTEEAQESQSGERYEPKDLRGQQLELLSRRYMEARRRAGFMELRTARRARWQSLDTAEFHRTLPGTSRLVFDLFSTLEDVHFLAANILSGHGMSVYAILDFDPEDGEHRYPSIHAAYERLYSAADTVYLKNEELPPPIQADEAAPRDITIVHANNRRSEVQAIAQAVAHFETQTAGEVSRPAVCFPAMDTYGPLAAEIFRDYQIPVQFARPTNVIAHPACELLDILGELSTQDAPALSAIRRLLMHPYATTIMPQGRRMSSGELVLWFDRIRLQESVSGSVQQFITAADKLADELLQLETDTESLENADSVFSTDFRTHSHAHEIKLLIHTMARWLDLLQEYRGSQPWAHWARQLIKLVALLTADRAADKTSLATEAAAQGHLHEICQRLLYCAHRLQLCATAFRQDSATFGEFVHYFKMLLTPERLIPQLERSEELIILDAETAAAADPEMLIMGGMCDGDFPRFARKEAVLGPSVDFHIRQQHLFGLQEYQFRRLVDSAPKSLLFVPKADGSEELLESIFLENLKRERAVKETDTKQLLGAFAQKRLPLSRALHDCGQWLASLAGHAIIQSPAKDTVKLPRPPSTTNLPDTQVANLLYNITANTHRKNLHALGDFDGIIREPNLKKVAAEMAAHRVFSPTQLDVLIQCPFKYFIEQVLRLEVLEEEEQILPATIRGQLVHGILEEFYSARAKAGGLPITNDNLHTAHEELRAIADRNIATLKTSDFERTQLRLYLLGAGGRTLAEIMPHNLPPEIQEFRTLLETLRNYPGLLPGLLAKEVSRAESSSNTLLVPVLFEHEFGVSRRGAAAASEPAPPLYLDCDGQKVSVRGIVDRVDADGECFAVVDYKTGTLPNITEQLSGTRVQIPLYLMAMQQLWSAQSKKLTPAGGFYYSLRPWGADAGGQLVRKQYLGRCGFSSRSKSLTDETFAELMALVRTQIGTAVRKFADGHFHITTMASESPCRYCPSSEICRKDIDRAIYLAPKLSGAGT